MEKRCAWVTTNPDIVVTLRAIRVELLLHYVRQHIVPLDDASPFLYWLRFEFGQSGNPHAHGLSYVPGNPEVDLPGRRHGGADGHPVDAGTICWLDYHDESHDEVVARIAHQVWLTRAISLTASGSASTTTAT